MRTSLLTSLLVLALSPLAACGGDDGADTGGVSGSKKLVDVTAADFTAICEANIGTYPEKTVTCDGDEDTVGIENCTEESGFSNLSDGCTATVDDFLNCLDVSYDQAESCPDGLPEACAPIFACIEFDVNRTTTSSSARPFELLSR